MLVVDENGDKFIGSPRLGDLETGHFTMLEPFSFDGFTTDTPSIDNGEPWSTSPTASGTLSPLTTPVNYYYLIFRQVTLVM
ncbi:MAG: hypothetical protein Q9M91_00960 [Candidatus Dojkabacteria bacterium]|nr:hypothetical protein [Candidatus Dojkabacteria bacterium]